MENSSNPHISTRISLDILDRDLDSICNIINKMLDYDIFVWLNRAKTATKLEIVRAATIVVDRLCGSLSDPIIRNEQEKRQLTAIENWLKVRNYQYVKKTCG
jgi:hypothetical protein